MFSWLRSMLDCYLSSCLKLLSSGSNGVKLTKIDASNSSFSPFDFESVAVRLQSSYQSNLTPPLLVKSHYLRCCLAKWKLYHMSKGALLSGGSDETLLFAT